MYDFGQQFSNSFMSMYQFNQQRKLDKERMGYEKDRVNMEQQRVNMAKEQYSIENAARAEEARLRALEHEQSMIDYSLRNEKSRAELDQYNAELAFRAANPVLLDMTNDGVSNPTGFDPRMASEYLPYAIGSGLVFKNGEMVRQDMQNYMIPNNNDIAANQMNEFANTRSFEFEKQKHQDTVDYQNKSLNIQGADYNLKVKQLNQETEDKKTTKAKTIDASMTAMHDAGGLRSPSLLSKAWNMPKGTAAQVNALNYAYQVAREEAKYIADTEGVPVEDILSRLRWLASNPKTGKSATEYNPIKEASPWAMPWNQGRGRN